jgi:cell shape-determining protein MreC
MTFTNTLKDRVKELESRVDNLQHENIKLKVHEDENLKQITKLREETIQLKAENTALDKELYAMKSKPDTSQS